VHEVRALALNRVSHLTSGRLRINCAYIPGLKDSQNFPAEVGAEEVDGLPHTIYNPASTFLAKWTAPLPEQVSPFAFITSLSGGYKGQTISGGDLRLLDLDE
jgi:hypothetical protein